MFAVRVHQTGGPEAMVYEEISTPAPGPGTVLVKVEAAGVNFIDIYQRTGAYPLPTPFTLGMEAAGTVAAVGSGVSEWREGDRVAYPAPGRTGSIVPGAYAEYVVIPADRLVSLPPAISAVDAAAAMLQGTTAHMLTHGVYRVKPGDRVLVHAAAGGTGRLIVQVAKSLGAEVYGTVSTAEKAAHAKAAGVDVAIRYTEVNFEEEVKRLTGGKGVQVVYDGVGKTTFEKSINCLSPRGYMVLFGAASGPPAPVDVRVLARGSLFLTRPMLFQYIDDRAELLERSNALFDWITSGQVKLQIDRTLPLPQAAEAHRLLQERATAGKLILVP